MAMLRTASFAASLSMGSSFEFVSQVNSGKVTTEVDFPGLPSAPQTGTTDLALDMERVALRDNVRTESNTTPIPGMKIHVDAVVGQIFDAKTKRYTSFSKTTTTVKDGPPQVQTVCSYFEMPSIKDASALKKCLGDVAATTKPVSSEGGVLQFEIKMDVPAGPGGGSGKLTEDFYTDESFLLHKIDSSTNVEVQGKNLKTRTLIEYVNTTAGAPQGSIFDIPEDWGTCNKATAPPVDPSTLTGPVKALYQCAIAVAGPQTAVIV